MKPDAPVLTVDDQVLAARLTCPRNTASDVREAQAALLELYRLYAPGLLAFLASRVPRADLEDIHQTVWQHVWQHAPRSFDGRHFRGWLYRIAHNLVIDQSRRRKTATTEDLDERPDAQDRPALEGLIEDERRRLLAQCLEKLGTAAREVVRGRLAGEDYPGLCERLRLSSQQAYKLYHTAVHQLRTCVEEIGG